MAIYRVVVYIPYCALQNYVLLHMNRKSVLFLSRLTINTPSVKIIDVKNYREKSLGQRQNIQR
jgi:hypothetical protein